MKTQTGRLGRFGQFVVAMLVAIVVIFSFGTVHAVPPANFGVAIKFNGSRDPNNAGAPWTLGNSKSCTTTGDASLYKPANLQSWDDINRPTFIFNISPGGTGSYSVWVPVHMWANAGPCKVKIEGILREVGRQETNAPATITYSGTAKITQTSGWEIEGWYLSTGTVSATGVFTHEPFETVPATISFPQDQTIFPGQGPLGFRIFGTLRAPIPAPPVMSPAGVTPPPDGM